MQQVHVPKETKKYIYNSYNNSDRSPPPVSCLQQLSPMVGWMYSTETFSEQIWCYFAPPQKLTWTATSTNVCVCVWGGGAKYITETFPEHIG